MFANSSPIAMHARTIVFIYFGASWEKCRQHEPYTALIWKQLAGRQRSPTWVPSIKPWAKFQLSCGLSYMNPLRTRSHMIWPFAFSGWRMRSSKRSPLMITSRSWRTRNPTSRSDCQWKSIFRTLWAHTHNSIVFFKGPWLIDKPCSPDLNIPWIQAASPVQDAVKRVQEAKSIKDSFDRRLALSLGIGFMHLYPDFIITRFV